jgi:hypothetical protein
MTRFRDRGIENAVFRTPSGNYAHTISERLPCECNRRRAVSARHENRVLSTVASDSRRYRSWGKGMAGLFPAAGHAASESTVTLGIALKEGAIRYSGGQPPADFRQAPPL